PAAQGPDLQRIRLRLPHLRGVPAPPGGPGTGGDLTRPRGGGPGGVPTRTRGAGGLLRVDGQGGPGRRWSRAAVRAEGPGAEGAPRLLREDPGVPQLPAVRP